MDYYTHEFLALRCPCVCEPVECICWAPTGPVWWAKCPFNIRGVNCTYLDVVLGEGDGTPLQYSCLENSMEGGVWWAAVYGVTKSQTRLSNFTFTFHFHALEKEMATHSSVLAWRIPGMGEPGGLLSMGSHRVRHDWSDLAAAAAADVVLTYGELLLILPSWLPF